MKSQLFNSANKGAENELKETDIFVENAWLFLTMLGVSAPVRTMKSLMKFLGVLFFISDYIICIYACRSRNV